MFHCKTAGTCRGRRKHLPPEAHGQDRLRRHRRLPEPVRVMTGGAPPLPPDDLLHMERLGRFRRLPNLWPHGDVRRPATVSTWLPAGGWLHCTQGTWPSSGIRTGTLIQILDMTKDIIVCGGENISSIEVESVISGHRAVLEVAAVARPDETGARRHARLLS